MNYVRGICAPTFSNSKSPSHYNYFLQSPRYSAALHRALMWVGAVRQNYIFQTQKSSYLEALAGISIS